MDSRVQPHFTCKLLHPVSQQLQTPRTSKYFNLNHKTDVLQNEQNGFSNLQGRYHQVHNEPELRVILSLSLAAWLGELGVDHPFAGTQFMPYVFFTESKIHLWLCQISAS